MRIDQTEKGIILDGERDLTFVKFNVKDNYYDFKNLNNSENKAAVRVKSGLRWPAPKQESWWRPITIQHFYWVGIGKGVREWWRGAKTLWRWMHE